MIQSLALFQTSVALAGEPKCDGPDYLCHAAPREWTTVGRSARGQKALISAHRILRLLGTAERRRLVSEYVARGEGLAMSRPAEKDAFLAFLAARLPYPSHALTVCHMAQALIRAQSGAESFIEPGIRTVRPDTDRALRRLVERAAWKCTEELAPRIPEPGVRSRIERELQMRIHAKAGVQAKAWVEAEAWECIARAMRGRVERGQHATLLWFHADPAAVIGALDGTPPPPVGPPAYPMLFAPGLPRFWRAATQSEAALWAALPSDEVEPDAIEQLLADGAVVYADQLMPVHPDSRLG
jgi:hypothetical protein